MRLKLGMGLLACGLVLMAACSKQQEQAADAMSPQQQDASAPAVAEEASGRAATAPAPPAAGTPAVSEQLQSAATTQQDGERKFIRTADARFRVREVYRSALAIEDLVTQHGGFVASNDIRTEIDDVETRSRGDGRLVELATYTVHANLQVRVPGARTQSFLRALASQIEFLDSRRFAAVDAQLEILRQQLAQARHQDAQRALGEVADGRGKAAEKADAISQRVTAQGQRDEALIAQREFEDRVEFATIDLALYQLPQVRRTERLDVDALVRQERPGFFVSVGHSLAVGWYGLLAAVIALVRLWPLWLVLAVIVFAVRQARRRGHGRAQSNAASGR